MEKTEESILDDELLNGDMLLKGASFAGFWIRLGAALIDFIVLVPIIILSTYNSLDVKSMLLMFVLNALAFLYKPLLEWKRSATLGKIVVGIKLVDESMNDIDLDMAIRRYLPWIISFAISTATNIFLFTSPEFQDIDQFTELGFLTRQMPLYWVGSLYNLIFLAIIGSLVFDSKKQGFHDKYARTFCIHVNK